MAEQRPTAGPCRGRPRARYNDLQRKSSNVTGTGGPLRIRDLYDRPVPTISFEFFPPKNDDAEAALFRDAVPGLKALNPAFISVTYGAGGSTRDTTTRIVQRLRDQC